MNPDTRTRILSTLGILVILGGLGYAGYRIVSGTRFSVGVFDRGEPATGIEMVHELRDFSRISADGGWRITVVPGDYDVSITVGERYRDDVRVGVSGETLSLGIASGIGSVTGQLEARVSMPDLTLVEIDGGADVTITGFELAELVLEIDGAASVEAVDTTLVDLDVDVDGAASIDFSRSSVENARVDLDGAARLTIRMAGGELTGELSGVGEVVYSGEVSRESIRVEGLGRVRRQ